MNKFKAHRMLLSYLFPGPAVYKWVIIVDDGWLRVAKHAGSFDTINEAEQWISEQTI